MCLPADDPGRPPHQSPRHAFARGNRAASPTLANRPELLPLSSLCLLPYYPQPSARRQAAEQPCVPYRRQLYTEPIKCMTQRPAQRTAERKAAYTASRPMHGGTVIDSAHSRPKTPHESLHRRRSIFCQIACQKTGRPASFDHRSHHLTGIRQWMTHAVKGEAAASFAQYVGPQRHGGRNCRSHRKIRPPFPCQGRGVTIHT